MRRDWDDPPTPAHDALRRAALPLLGLVLAFVLGWRMGTASSHTPPPECPPAIEPACAEPVCPECPAPVAAAPRAPRRPHVSAARPSQGAALPMLPAHDEDSLRAPLLQWAREHAPSLRACLDEGAPRESFRVSLRIAGGRIERGDVDATRGELAPARRRCLRERIEGWTVPSALLGRLGESPPESLIFTLAL